jgi:hypothetical protein
MSEIFNSGIIATYNKELLKAEAQRDELLEALKRIDGQYNCLECGDCHGIIRAAIEKVEGDK